MEKNRDYYGDGSNRVSYSGIVAFLSVATTKEHYHHDPNFWIFCLSWCTFLCCPCLSCVVQQRKRHKLCKCSYTNVWIWWLWNPQFHQERVTVATVSASILVFCPLNIYLIPQVSLAPLEKAFKGRCDLRSCWWSQAERKVKSSFMM